MSHIKKVFLVGDNTVQLSDDDEEEIEEPMCPLCDKKFKTLRAMVTHKNQAHFGKVEGTVRFDCQNCGKSYVKAKYLGRHLKKCTPQ